MIAKYIDKNTIQLVKIIINCIYYKRTAKYYVAFAFIVIGHYCLKYSDIKHELSSRTIIRFILKCSFEKKISFENVIDNNHYRNNRENQPFIFYFLLIKM